MSEKIILNLSFNKVRLKVQSVIVLLKYTISDTSIIDVYIFREYIYGNNVQQDKLIVICNNYFIFLKWNK